MAERRQKSRKKGALTDRLPRPPIKPAAAIFAVALLASFLLGRRAQAPVVKVPDKLPDWIWEELIPVNEWSRPGTAMTAVNGIVVHYVGNPGSTAEQNRSYFAGLAQSHETYASSNFLVGLDGEVLLCVPIGEVAYCSNDRNSDTLSIEVCHPDETGAFTQASYDSLVKLVNWLREFYGLEPEDVIRHYDVTGKVCPKYFVDKPEAWEEFHRDLAAGG